ncbi:MAG: autotransporter outer membrane beta-barrel domain-containing protein, partial [Enterobacter roggenkampii]
MSEITGIHIGNSSTAEIGPGSRVISDKVALIAGGLWGSGGDKGSATLNFKGSSEKRNLVSGAVDSVRSLFEGIANISFTDFIGAGDGILASNGGTVNGNELNITGQSGTHGIRVQTDGSKVNLDGSNTITMNSVEDIAIRNSGGEVNVDGKLQMQGRVVINQAKQIIGIDGEGNEIEGIVGDGGRITLNLESGSHWRGSSQIESVAPDAHLAIMAKDSHWDMMKDSRASVVSLNNSQVNFHHGTDDTVFYTLTTDQLSGNGTFNMSTDLVGNGAGSRGDKIVVLSDSQGSHLLSFTNRGSMATTGREVLTVVETPDGTGTFSAVAKVELGGYLYDVRKNGTNWELASNLPEEKPTPPDEKPTPPDEKPTPPDEKPTTKPELTTSAVAGGNMLRTGYLLNYAENQTLLQRMGDIRQSQKEGNAWMRAFNGKFDTAQNGQFSQTNLRFTGTQIGFDKRFFDGIALNTGVLMGETRGNAGFTSGTETLNSHHLGLYATYQNDDGLYLDGIAKWSRQKHNFSVKDSQQQRVSGNASTTGLSLSVEGGKRFMLSENYYLEPQAQVTYGYQTASSATASNGLNIGLERFRSLTGRTSLLAGYEKEGTNVYVKTGIVREFDGKGKFTLNGTREKLSMNGNVWDNGIGISAQVMPNHTLYLEADRSLGNQFNQSKVGGGYRFTF